MRLVCTVSEVQQLRAENHEVLQSHLHLSLKPPFQDVKKFMDECYPGQIRVLFCFTDSRHMYGIPDGCSETGHTDLRSVVKATWNVALDAEQLRDSQCNCQLVWYSYSVFAVHLG